MNRCDRRTAIVFTASIAFASECGAANKGAAPITSLVFSPDGANLIAGSQSGVSIRDAITLQEVAHLKPEMDNIHDLRFNRQGNLLAVAGGNPGEQGVVELIDWPKRELHQRIRWHDDVVESIDFSPDDQRFVTASTDATCHVFERTSSKPIARFTQHSKPVRSVQFLSDGDTIVSASNDETIRVWEATSGKTIRTLHNHSGEVHALSVRPSDGASLAMIASASADMTIRFWQPTIGRMVRFARLSSEPLCIEWARDGTHLIAGCRDGWLRLVDPASVNVTQIQKVAPAWLYAIAVDPLSDHQIAVGASDGSVKRSKT